MVTRRPIRIGFEVLLTNLSSRLGLARDDVLSALDLGGVGSAWLTR